MPEDPRIIASDWITVLAVITPEQTILYFTEEHLVKMEPTGLVANCPVFIVEAPQMLGIIPLEKLGPVSSFIEQHAARIVRSRPIVDPAPWCATFEGVPTGLAPGKNYIKFSIGKNGLAAVFNSDKKALESSPYKM